MFKVEDSQKRANAINEIQRLASKYFHKNEVSCAYFVPYNKDGKVIYELCIVYKKSITDRYELDSTRWELNDKYKKENNIENFGGRICISFSSEDRIPSSIRILSDTWKLMDLASSIIIFDKTGYCTKASHVFDFNEHKQKYDNLVEIDQRDMEVLDYIRTYRKGRRSHKKTN